MQESITHSVDFFTAIIFVFFYERATQSRHPPSAVIEKEIASKAATLNKLKKRNNRNKPNLLCVAHDLRCYAECGSFLFSFARVCITQK